MYLVISDEVLNYLLAEAESDGTLVGVRVDGGDVLRLLGPLHSHGALLPVGRWRKLQTAAPVGETALLAAAHTEIANHDPLLPNEVLLLLYVGPEAGAPVCHFFRANATGVLESQPFERLALYADYRSRLQGLFDSVALANCTVGIVGLGTGGSLAAVELAKAGVGHFRLADFDRLEVHNLARHVCGLRDLGRYKTEAMRDYLLNTSPIVQVETFNFDITEDDEVLGRFMDGCDLVIGAADSEAAKSYLNRAAWERGIGAVYGAAYDRGFGGDVFQALPPDGPCYECFRNATAELFNVEPRPDELDYGKLVAQPALGLDVSFPALILARAALTLLLAKYGESTPEMSPFHANWVIWGNQPVPGWLTFDAPLQSDYVDIPIDPHCPVCQTARYLQDELHLTAAEVAAEADELLTHLPAFPGSMPTAK